MNVVPIAGTTRQCCVYELVQRQLERNPDAIAIFAPGRRPLTYRRLSRQVDDVIEALRCLGIGRNERVAMVLPEGPEMAVAFISISGVATCAPLNPAYCVREFQFHLTDLNARALLVLSGSSSPAIGVAQDRGIPILELSPSAEAQAEAGLFTLTGKIQPGRRQQARAEADDVALVLHTSGTAARPKLVPLTHRNICASAQNIRVAVELVDSDRCLNVMPLFHIHGLSTIFASLAAGASVVCPGAFSGSAFFKWLEEFRPTWYTAAPTIHQVILENAQLHPGITARSSLRFIRSASSPMPRQVMADLERVFRVPFIEAYGMTEAAPQIASNRLPPCERKPGSVGQAAGPEVAIMDQAGHLLPPGETGEVVIRGTNVIQAYDNHPAADNSAFTQGWLRTGDQGHLDADRYLFITGRLKDIINRGGEKISPQEVDDVFMEHPSIAQAVTFAVPHPTLGENIATAIVLNSGFQKFGQLTVQAAAATPEHLISQIRQFVTTRLAHFKVPQHIVIVEEIPKGPTGKLQRIGLAEKLRLSPTVKGSKARPSKLATLDSRSNGAPRTSVEEKLTGIWAEVLCLDQLGVHDNFFQLGGHSLSASQVVARLRHDLEVDLPMATVFERPTVAELAELVSQRLAERGAPPDKHSQPRPNAPSVFPSPAITRRSSHDSCPLSFAQQRLWFLDQIEPGNPAYNMHVALRLTGALRLAALEHSLDEMVRRHEALRTTFRTVRGQSVQVVAPVKPLRLPVVDISHLPTSDRETEALRLAAEEAGRPFHLGHGPLFRATLLRLEAEQHVLLLTMHHIVSDGWSMRVLYRELGTLYRAFSSSLESPLLALPIQYADYAIWQREWLQGGILEHQVSYWKEQLGLSHSVIELPTDRPRPAIQTYRGSRFQMAIPIRVTEGLMALSGRESATPFMTLLAAFQTLLFRYTGQHDMRVGTPIANRTRVEIEPLIGFFANTLVLRTDLSGDPPFREALARVRATAMGAYAHQDLPFEKLVEELQPERDPSHTPLFQVMFVFESLPNGGTAPRSEAISRDAESHEMDGSCPPLELASGLTASPLKVDSGTAKFDLTLYLSETHHGLAGTWQYNMDLFDAVTIERMSGHFQILLEGIVLNAEQPISRLPLLSDVERHQLLAWNQAHPVSGCAAALASLRASSRDRCFHHLFEEQVERTPDAVAVRSQEGQLTYGELNRRANQLARRLHTLAVGNSWTSGADTLVGIYLTRSVETVVALLGVLKAGAAYLPLDPEYPAERLAFMLKDARVPILITEERVRDHLPPHEAIVVCLDTDRKIIASEANQNPISSATATSLAYVIYTSGSTGKPKGVMITHANLSHYVQTMREAIGITADDRYLHTASFAFSSSVRQFALPLSCGASVVVATTDQIRDPAALFDFIRQEGVSIIDIVSSYWRSCNQVLARLDPTSRAALLDNQLRLILAASEPLVSDLPREWALGFRHGARLINMFGQTETTGIVTVHPIVPHDGDARRVPIGRPIPNTRVYLLDPSQQPVPRGIVGEMCIGGAGIGRGYLNHPELTADRFVPDPFSEIPGARLYRTGDVARYLPDGTIEFLGRIDHQIKIRGFRVEPGEIEAVARQHPGVRESVVVAREEVAGRRRLVAYVVPSESVHKERAPEHLNGRRPRSLGSQLRGFLKQKLPEYMVPSAIVELEALPLSPNGKVDRKALATRSMSAELEGERPVLEEAFAAERTQAEQILAKVWAQILGVDRVGLDDNFFDLGGDSILSMQIISRANEAGLRLRHIHIFQHQTIGELARVAYTDLAAPQPAVPRTEKAATKDTVLPNDLSLVKEVEPAVRVTMESLRAYSREALERAGLTPEGAAIVTEVQIEASLRGQPTHNVGAIPRYARRIASRLINPRPSLRIERETRISALIDGDNGPGQWISVMAMELAIRKARACGVGVVTARRSNHFGAAGHYAWLAARENLIGLCTSNAPLWLAPTGGLTPTFGNNPLGVGIPAAQYHPIVLDISLSVAAKGKIGLHLAEGKPLPPGWIFDRFGRPSTDPADLAAGLGVPIAGHKGYGLTLVMEVLAGVLSGAGFCQDHSRERMRRRTEPPDLGHFFMAIDPELFMPVAEFTARIDWMIEQTKMGERAGNLAEILVPGEAEMRARERNLREGVPLLPSTVQALRKHREAAGLKTELIAQICSGEKIEETETEATINGKSSTPSLDMSR